jgi:hypothetical protein
MRTFPSMLALFGVATLVAACANDTLRAQTPVSTTGPYNTGTTATHDLSAENASHATGESEKAPVGPIAPAPTVGVSATTGASVNTGTVRPSMP